MRELIRIGMAETPTPTPKLLDVELRARYHGRQDHEIHARPARSVLASGLVKIMWIVGSAHSAIMESKTSAKKRRNLGALGSCGWER